MDWNQGAQLFTDALATSHPTPGGGAAAAMAAAMGCALGMMAVSTTLKRKNTPQAHRPILEQGLQKLSTWHDVLKTFMAKDAQAYGAYLAAVKLPPEDASRPTQIQETLWQAAQVPADTARVCKAVLEEIQTLHPFIDKIIISDAVCAAHLLRSAIACCVENIRANASYITPTDRAEKLHQIIRDLQ